MLEIKDRDGVTESSATLRLRRPKIGMFLCTTISGLPDANSVPAGCDSTTRRPLSSTKHLKPFFGGLLMQRIGDSDITEFQLNRRDDGASNAEINRELAIVRRAFKLAKIPNPPEIRMLKEAAPRNGFFEREQFEGVRSHLDDDLADVVTFDYYTGWRISEILNLERRQIEWKTGTVRLDAGTTKNDEGRVVNFGRIVELREMLRRRRAETDALSRKRGEIVPWGFIAVARSSEISGARGPRLVAQRGVPIASCTIFGGPPFATLTARGCPGVSRCRWSDTKRRPSTTATGS